MHSPHTSFAVLLFAVLTFLTIVVILSVSWINDFKASEMRIKNCCLSINNRMSLDEVMDIADSYGLKLSHFRGTLNEVPITVVEAGENMSDAWSVCTLRHDMSNDFTAVFDPWYH